MQVLVLCVGHLKEQWQKDACKDYLKRLTRYGRYDVVEVDDQPEPAHAGEALQQKVMQKEGLSLMHNIRPEDFVVALCIDGEAPDSPGLARLLKQWSCIGKRIVLIIGGSLGLSQEVLQRANLHLSFSRLTFPHPLMRVILLEQLYRANKINAGERYHK